MAKKEKRLLVTLECKTCGEKNYSSQKNKLNTKEKVELKKFCNHCRKHTLHKEIK